MVPSGSDPPAGDDFRISVRDDAGRPTVVVEGEVDVATAPALRDELYRLIEQGSREAPPGAPWRARGRGAVLLPHDAGTDGMYVLRLRRT